MQAAVAAVPQPGADAQQVLVPGRRIGGPALQAAAGGVIDVVVERKGAGGEHVRLALRPAKWAGEGLLGCKLKDKGPVVEAKPEWREKK